MKEVVDQYKSGMTVPQLGKMFHRRQSSISKMLNENGIDTVKNAAIRAADTRRNRPITCLIVDKKINANISKIEWAYIAGFFDAEGCIEGANKNKDSGKYNGYRISIAQNEKETLEWIQKKIGDGTMFAPSTRKCKMYRILSQKSVWQFLVAIFPYLIVKKTKANEALLIYEERYEWNRGRTHKLSKREGLAYIAGILDGDGCITLSKNEYGKDCYRILISQKGITLHNWLKNFLGYGRIRMRKQPKNISHLEPVNTYVIDALLHQENFAKKVLPFAQRTRNKLLCLLEHIEDKKRVGLHRGIMKLPKTS